MSKPPHRNPTHKPGVVVLTLRTVSEANQREHWAVKAKRVSQHRLVAFNKAPFVKLPCIVTLTRVAPRELDDDNLRGAMKAIRDGIADRLLIDDRDPRVTWNYAQEKAREYAVRVEITAVTSEAA